MIFLVFVYVEIYVLIRQINKSLFIQYFQLIIMKMINMKFIMKQCMYG